MFWKLSFRQRCAIDSLLENEECTLDEILDEDDIIQECKSNNKKLTDFLTRPEILERLVQLICCEPKEDAADKVKFKYPHLACELLTSEVFTIVEQLSTSQNLLDMLWSFLDNTEPLNPLLASFISKVLAMLLAKEASVIVEYIKNKEDFISKYLQHLGTSAIMDLLLHMVTTPDTDGSGEGLRFDLAIELYSNTMSDLRSVLHMLLKLLPSQKEAVADPLQDVCCLLVEFSCATVNRVLEGGYILSYMGTVNTSNKWLKDEGLVERLVDFIKEDADPEQCVNASLTLCEMIRISRESYQKSRSAPLHAVLESKEMLDKLLRNILTLDSPSNVLVVSGISVLLVLLREIMPVEPELVEPMESLPMETKPSPGIAHVLEVIVPWLGKFHILLKLTPECSLMSTTVGLLDPPLGNMRLQIVKLISALMGRMTSAIALEMVMLDMFTTLIDLFFAFPWNNFLHMQVELCVRAVLDSSHVQDSARMGEDDERGDMGQGRASERGEGADNNGTSSQDALKLLTVYLLKECQFVSKLLEGASKNEVASKDKSSCSRRQGYMGHLVRISNTLVKFGEMDEQFKLSLDETTQQKWNNYVNGPLAEMNKRNETNLGGNQPLSSNMDDSDDEYDPTPLPGDSELEKAYHQYLDLKYSANYLEKYGVDDELSGTEEPFEASFTRLMDITRIVDADEKSHSSSSTPMFDAACSERIQQFDDEVEEDEDDEVSGAWPDKDVNVSSPMEHRSASSDEDEEFGCGREFATGESYEGSTHLHGSPRRPLLSNERGNVYMKKSPPGVITQINNPIGSTNDPDKMEIENSFGMPWRATSNKDDLSVNVPMAGASDWTKEPDMVSTSTSSASGNSADSTWADFSKFSCSSSIFGSSNIQPATGGIAAPVKKNYVTPSHITVTYIPRDMPNISNDDDDDFLEPLKRPNTSKYNELTPEGKQKRHGMDVDGIIENFEGVGVTSYDSDEDDDLDSDDEKMASYNLNISRGSEGEQLINSLNDSREQEMATSPLSLQSSNFTPSKDTQSGKLPSDPGKTSPSLSDRHGAVGVVINDSTSLFVEGDTRVSGGTEDLQDNYKYLSKQGLISSVDQYCSATAGGSGSATTTTSNTAAKPAGVSLLEQKRAEALEACAIYTNEVSEVAMQQGSIET